jgi:RNA-directed DNA polymerase
MAVEQRDAGRWIENGIKMSEENLSTVTSDKEPKQDKEALRARWAWVEHSVWTDSMLRTLEKGLKGGKWFALIDKVYGEKNLQSSFWKVWRNAGSAGIDGQSVKSFEAKEEQQLPQLAQELRTGGYRPVAVKRVWIPKPGSQEKRPLGIPTVVSYCTSFNGLLGSAAFNTAGAGNPSS